MKQKEQEDIRQIYLENRAAMLEQFNSALKEAQQDAPSMPGKVAGMDFQQFSAKQVFFLIKEQEEYTKPIAAQAEYVDAKEEKKILRDMIKRAKAVFGDQYDEWYHATDY